MGLDSLGFSLPWMWGSSQVAVSASSGSHGKRHKRKSSSAGGPKSKAPRTRAEQIALKNGGKHSRNEDSDYDDEQYYPGLVNISGTYCFMNSTLQALASLTYLQPYVDAIHAKAEALDVPTPVIDALQELFTNLNTPKSSYHSLRPHGIINALSSPPPPPLNSGSTTFHPSTSTSLFNSREHQDAQELFQLVSESIKNEMTAVDREGLRDRGIAGVLDLKGKSSADSGKQEPDVFNDLEPRSLSSKSVFDGLTANRRSCVMCGYTEAVMHFGFDNWQLAVPRLATSCRLEDCLEDYTRLEILKDCICRKCSVLATHKRLLAELKTLEDALAPAASSPSALAFSPSSPVASSSAMPSSSSSPQKSKPSQSKKKRFKEVKRMEQRVKTALAEGRIEDETLLEGVRLEKVVSPASTKQAMIARPPPVLALHLNRSVHYGNYAAKNTIRVHFPEVLDLTPFTTSGSLSTVPTSSISTPLPPSTSLSDSRTPSSINDADQPPRRSTTPTQDTYTPGMQRTIYRLAAVVCHYGQHSFGHYICYRRKPRGFTNDGGWAPPTLVDPLLTEDQEEAEAGHPGIDADLDTDMDAAAQGTIRASKRGQRPSAGDYFSAPYTSASSSSSAYHWLDQIDAEGPGTNRGWLRISDDAVEECGIERVLAEGSGAFMLYYERAVQPRVVPGMYSKHHGGAATPRIQLERERVGVPIPGANGKNGRHGSVHEYGDEGGADTDADELSIGSEETLKPELRVLDLNGSVGSLVSEVGVGVMKVQKKEHSKEKDLSSGHSSRPNAGMSMSMHLPGSSASSSSSLFLSPFTTKGFGPRIIRNVSVRRHRPSSNGSVGGLSSLSSSFSSSSSIDASTPVPNGHPLVNGSASHAAIEEDKIPPAMIASAPSILDSASAFSIGAASVNGSNSNSHSPSRAALGSRSTKVLRHVPASPNGMKVKAR